MAGRNGGEEKIDGQASQSQREQTSGHDFDLLHRSSLDELGHRGQVRQTPAQGKRQHLYEVKAGRSIEQVHHSNAVQELIRSSSHR